ncbi:MAG: fumarylacetoacetate hydrolase family protein, partial [Pseudonocardia sp.]|nr:fumarylacetoacetate hydrolase family protein [Pseudonocardia sp.]
AGPPFEWDWLASKGRDTFCPIGPGVTPSWLVDDPQALSIRLTVNGRIEQDGTTANMIYPVAAMVAAASRLLTLEPGDIVATGTPAGVGLGKNRFLTDGDVIEITISAVGTLRNPVQATQPVRRLQHDQRSAKDLNKVWGARSRAWVADQQ